MPSPADRQVEALADVRRIGQAIYDALPILARVIATPESCRHVAIVLLQRDVIRVGKRPQVAEQLAGQISIEDEP